MKPFVAKEIRLLLPDFILALLLSTVPGWFLLWRGHGDDFLIVTFSLLCFGVFMMTLTSFGREFASGTFPLLLSLPLTRARIWWTKMAVLICAMAIVFGVFCFSTAHWASSRGEHIDFTNVHSVLDRLVILVIVFVTILSSGLWTTLLLRQMLTAFWFALLIPAAIVTVIFWNGGTIFTVEITLGIYSVIGLYWAKRQFYQAQEVPWTGGEVALPEWRSARAVKGASGRSYRPVAAFVWKEIRLYQVALVGMAALFIVHLAVVWLRNRLRGDGQFFLINSLLSEFGGIWLIVTLFTGALNVADERRMGTMESQLCLPISTRKQFVIKLLMVIIVSGLLNAGLLLTAESIGQMGQAGISEVSLHGAHSSTVFFIFLNLALVVFYASSLTRSVLQAIVASVIFAPLLFSVLNVNSSQSQVMGLWLFVQPLFSIITWLTMILAILVLSYRNYKRLLTSRLLWIRNVRGLIFAMLFAVVFTTLISNRTWELLTPIEPPHGAARLTISQSPILQNSGRNVSVLLPDGRFWSKPIVYNRVIEITNFGSRFNLYFGGGKGIEQNDTPYIEGANWTNVIDTSRETIGIKSDHTLWVSKTRTFWYNDINDQRRVFPPSEMVRFGTNTDWKSVSGYGDLILLKTNGTLWGWEIDNYGAKNKRVRPSPQQLGIESNWSKVSSSQLGTFVWKSNGVAWRLDSLSKGQKSKVALDYELKMERWPVFDHTTWRSLTKSSDAFSLAVRDDGTLWTFGEPSTNKFDYKLVGDKPQQVGSEKDWISVAGNFEILVALKADGTLWQWNLDEWRQKHKWPFDKPSTRFSTHDDWVAIAGSWDGIASLAADGSIWWWPNESSAFWLRPSRKPYKADNIFAK